ncbi:hypothetical protein PR048_015652 [Dryococelus australis]|uniref:Uncharacterized protein n=1 Tax=Dryococelus australis TaxID=614101 RepID=A0ABQ9HHI3_9NEOP|nr:hypothetical protein PR048_015652 [Dryococelus australis]
MISRRQGRPEATWAVRAVALPGAYTSPVSEVGHDGVVFRLLKTHQGKPGSIPGGVTRRIFTRRDRAGRCLWLAGFLADLPFLPPLHSVLHHTHLASPSSALNNPNSIAEPDSVDNGPRNSRIRSYSRVIIVVTLSILALEWMPGLAPGLGAAASAWKRGRAVCCHVAECVFSGPRGPIYTSRPTTARLRSTAKRFEAIKPMAHAKYLLITDTIPLLMTTTDESPVISVIFTSNGMRRTLGASYYRSVFTATLMALNFEENLRKCERGWKRANRAVTLPITHHRRSKCPAMDQVILPPASEILLVTGAHVLSATEAQAGLLSRPRSIRDNCTTMKLRNAKADITRDLQPYMVLYKLLQALVHEPVYQPLYELPSYGERLALSNCDVIDQVRNQVWNLPRKIERVQLPNLVGNLAVQGGKCHDGCHISPITAALTDLAQAPTGSRIM